MRQRTRLALTLFAALAGASAYAARTPPPPEVTVFDWRMDHQDFGGWSAIDVSADGRQFWTVGDSGSILTGELVRKDGRLAGVISGPPNPIRGEHTPANGLTAEDAEGISVDADGRVLVSYERFPRVWRHEDWSASAERIPQSAAFDGMPFNGSLEAVATLPDGSILTLPEVSTDNGSTPVYLYDGSLWQQPYSLSQDGRWRSVGADVGPDEQLYLLERRFLGIGFQSRIRRFDLAAAAGVLEGETLYRSPLWRHDNLEGIGVWRDGDGQLRAVLVSDDNFLPVLRSQIVEVILPE